MQQYFTMVDVNSTLHGLTSCVHPLGCVDVILRPLLLITYQELLHTLPCTWRGILILSSTALSILLMKFHPPPPSRVKFFRLLWLSNLTFYSLIQQSGYRFLLAHEISCKPLINPRIFYSNELQNLVSATSSLSQFVKVSYCVIPEICFRPYVAAFTSSCASLWAITNKS